MKEKGRGMRDNGGVMRGREEGRGRRDEREWRRGEK